MKKAFQTIVAASMAVMLVACGGSSDSSIISDVKPEIEEQWNAQAKWIDFNAPDDLMKAKKHEVLNRFDNSDGTVRMHVKFQFVYNYDLDDLTAAQQRTYKRHFGDFKSGDKAADGEYKFTAQKGSKGWEITKFGG